MLFSSKSCIMIDFSNYLKNPVYCENRKPDFKVFLGLLLLYFVAAFVLGYIRMKNGLAYSILFHIVVNLIALVL